MSLTPIDKGDTQAVKGTCPEIERQSRASPTTEALSLTKNNYEKVRGLSLTQYPLHGARQKWVTHERREDLNTLNDRCGLAQERSARSQGQVARLGSREQFGSRLGNNGSLHFSVTKVTRTNSQKGSKEVSKSFRIPPLQDHRSECFCNICLKSFHGSDGWG